MMICGRLYRGFVVWLLMGCTSALAQTDLYQVDKLPGISQMSTDDYSPAFFKRGIVFSSDRPRGAIDRYANLEDNSPIYNYYYAILKKDGTIENIELLDQGLVTRSNKGPVVFSPDFKIMYFTKDNLEPMRFKSSRRDNPCGIYIADARGSKWKDIRPFPYCVGQYNYGHPALTHDGTRMYFSSDTTGGYGGYDIWYCDLKNGEWTAPVNAGPKINTAGDEGYPFCHISGRLYFASTGHESKGKKSHLYWTEQVNGEWIDATSLPEPFNTRFSNKSFVTDSAMSRGFFVEERRNKGNIFFFRTNYALFQNPKPIEEPKLCFTFYDKTAPQLDTSAMMYEWDFGTLGKVKGAEANKCFPGPGTYNVNLNVIDKLTGDLYFSQASYPFEIKDIKQIRIKGPLTCNVNQSVQYTAELTAGGNLSVTQYFWKIGPYDVATGQEVNYVFHKPGTYTIVCRLTAIDEKKKEVSPAICNFITVEVKDATYTP